MFPSPFEYSVASSVDHAVELLQQHGDEGRLLAGGHSLLPLMKLRLAAPSALIDIGRIPELRHLSSVDGQVHLGSLVTYSEVMSSSELAKSCPLLAETAAQVGDTQVRNRGTVGGSAAHADPAADMPAALLALDAALRIRGPAGDRTLRASDFFVGPFTTGLDPDEVLTEIVVPPAVGRRRSAYEKLHNPASGYAVVGVAVVLLLDEAGAVTDARIALTGASSQPVRVTAVEDKLRGQTLDETVIASASVHVTDGLEIAGDGYASPDYRAHVARVYTRRALQRAIGQMTA
jgi:carbon-monoxide dehydrogenase medium subunit